MIKKLWMSLHQSKVILVMDMDGKLIEVEKILDIWANMQLKMYLDIQDLQVLK
ncbi:hypothetical protein SDC9_178122 [bioreactor metagenome]|uniref:Uncharacterized protein n=1 Tax=bioreactor metagenome TaxID=1076179 RepID=A0A645GUW3_9ZZZZ